MYFVHFWDGCPWKDTSLTVPPTCWFRAQRQARRSYGGGWVNALQDVWRLVGTEIRSNNTLSDWLSGFPRGVSSKRFPKGFIVSLLSGAEIVWYLLSSTIK